VRLLGGGNSIGDLSHLHACDTSMVLMSRAPLASIERFRQRMGWAVPWYSSHGSDFNVPPHEVIDDELAATAEQADQVRLPSRPGENVFLADLDRR
jgi:predicted dithiol-disulfide oxidoreductase (DUF899 family)